jgi:hypothetical protein
VINFLVLEQSMWLVNAFVQLASQIHRHHYLMACLKNHKEG